MSKLMKYEFRKTLVVKLVLLGATALAEITFLIGLWGNKNDTTGTGALLLALLAFGGCIVIGLASVVILHRDMNTKQSYMLFMTPNSSYRILGAKVLENGLSIILTGACFFALGALDISLLFAHEGRLAELWDTVTRILNTMDKRLTFDLGTMASLTANLLASWISTITAAYLGVVISTALLNGRRLSGLVSFLLIVALLWLVSWIDRTVTASIASIQTTLWVGTGIALVCSVIMYILTANIMDRKLSV